MAAVLVLNVIGPPPAAAGFLPFSQHRPADYYRSNYPGKICKQTRWNRMPRLFYSYGSEVNRCYVKRSLRASINRRRSQTDQVVGSKAMHNVREEGERRASAERSHQGKREKVGWKLQWRQDWRKQATQQIDSASAFKHPDRYQHRYEKRNDLQNYAETFLRALDKFVIDLHAARRCIEWEEAKEKWYRQNRQRVHAADKDILRRRLGCYWNTKQIRRHHPDKKHNKENNQPNQRKQTEDR